MPEPDGDQRDTPLWRTWRDDMRDLDGFSKEVPSAFKALATMGTFIGILVALTFGVINARNAELQARLSLFMVKERSFSRLQIDLQLSSDTMYVMTKNIGSFAVSNVQTSVLLLSLPTNAVPSSISTFTGYQDVIHPEGSMRNSYPIPSPSSTNLFLLIATRGIQAILNENRSIEAQRISLDPKTNGSKSRGQRLLH